MSALRRRSLPAWIEVLALLAASAATTYLTIISSFEWLKRPGWIVASIVVVGLVALYGTVWPRIESKLVKKIERNREIIDATLQGLLFAVADEINNPAYDVRKFTASFMIIRGFKRWARLDTANRQAFGEQDPTDIRWTRGKGTIGVAWDEDHAVFDDLNSIHSKYKGCSRAAWDAAPASTRRGLSFEEWRKTEDKYGTIVAACTRNPAGRIIGIVSVTAPLGLDLTVKETDLKRYANGTAKTIAKFLKSTA